MLPTVSQKLKFAKAELSPTRPEAIPNKRFPESFETSTLNPPFCPAILIEVVFKLQVPPTSWDIT